MNSETSPRGQATPSFLARHGLFLGLLLAAATLGFLSQFQWLGHIVIVLYAIIALKLRIPPRTTFVAALLALAMVPVAIILANWLVAQNFGAYAFMLFVFGTISITIDLRRELYAKK